MPTRSDDKDREKRPVWQRNAVAFRAELGVSQETLASLAGLSIDTIRGYEQGRREPERDSLRALAAVFGRTMDDFYAEAPPLADPAKQRRFNVAFKIVGEPPPGFEAELGRFMARYTTDEAMQRSEEKKKTERPRPPPPKRR